MAPPDLADVLLWLCSIPSVTGQEKALCDELFERLSRVGFAHDRLRRHGNSLVVHHTVSSSGPRIGLFGHLDVVPTTHDAPPRIESDRLYGPGASDMKSGLALMLGLAEQGELANIDLWLVFYAGEEGPYQDNELGMVLEQEPVLRRLDFGLVLEPTDNTLQLGCGGTLHARVSFVGRSAHSARPWQGDNAIYRAIPFLAELSELAAVPHVVDGLTWMSSMSATLIEAGSAPNVIPETCTVNVNARFAPDQSPESVIDELRARLDGRGELSVADLSPPAPPHRNSPFVIALKEVGSLEIAPKFGWTDVARLSAAGICAANFGPGMLSQCHQRNEWTSLRELQRGWNVLLAFLSRVEGLPRGV
jgi:succinyl-diaminopimelate desuccinylase